MTIPNKTRSLRILRKMYQETMRSAWFRKNKPPVRCCAQCGKTLVSRFLKVENRRRRLCLACGHVAYENPVIVVATLPQWRGKIVLLRRGIEPALGKWTFPAGFLERGETVEQGAQRETREEICCGVDLAGPPLIFSYRTSSVVTVVFPARVTKGRPKPGSEALCVDTFRPGEIPWEDLAFRSTFQALHQWAKQRNS